MVKNGFSFYDVYTMPIYLRNFYTKLIIKDNEEQNEEMNKVNKKSNLPSDKNKAKVPGYVNTMGHNRT